MSVDIDLKGPLFDGRLERAVNAAPDKIEREVGNRGVNIVRNELDQVLKHQTGHYRSSIQTSNAIGSTLITDGGVVYGPWLDGSGSRNDTSRFKGYAHWRRATQRLEAESVGIANDIVEDAVEGRGH